MTRRSRRDSFDHEVGKKMVEREEALRFLESYCYISDISDYSLANCETPDSLVSFDGGPTIGLELTSAVVDACDLPPFDENDGPTFDPIVVLEEACRVLEKKMKAHQDVGVLPPESVIVVVALKGISLEEIEYLLDISVFSDFEAYGFREIWLMDVSSIQVWGSADLFAVFPRCRWGRYDGPRHSSKPYG